MSDLETKAKENKSERDQELNDLRSILKRNTVNVF